MNKPLILTKRKKIIVISFLTVLIYFLSHHYFDLSLFSRFIIGLISTYGFSLWAFDFDLKRKEYIILPLIPILFYVSMLLTFPILERLGVAAVSYFLVFGGMYVLLLTLNILNIATTKPIPLSKAAWVSLSLWRFIISFLVYTFLFWFHFDWYIIIFLIFVFTVFLTYPGFYLLINQLGRGERSFYYIFSTTLLVVEIGFVMAFWQLPFFGAGLIVASFLYVLTGLIEAQLKAQLTKSFFWEYGVVMIFALALLFFL